MPVALSTTDLVVDHGPLRALDGVSIEVPVGSTVAVIGPNGSGKSTLLKTIAGILTPSRGRVEVRGPAPAIVLQSTEVDRSVPISVRDTVAMARYPSLGLFGRYGADDRAVVDEALARLDLTDLADRPIHQLSGGQRQRVLVAQGIAQRAPLLLLDEPLTGLDVRSRSIITDALDDEHRHGRTLISTTHNFRDAEQADLVLLLATRCVAYGAPAEVLTEEHLREAFGGRFVRVGDTLLLDDPHHDPANRR
ncbi:MAG: metal ABC transporter ATP-binding protein [Actinomycetota bacterium]